METETTLNNTIVKAIYERRATRKFKNASLSKEVINAILDAGRMAPSAMNKQPWHFYVVSNKERIKKMSDTILHHSKMAMFKAGIKEVVNHILHPGSFHLKDGIDFFKQDDPVFHGAPLVVFIASPRSNEWAPIDVGMCAQNMMLYAHSIGLASCPIGFAKFIENTDEYELLKVPSSEHINLALIFGYADESPALHERKKDNAVFIDA
jgi:nitroreductase